MIGFTCRRWMVVVALALPTGALAGERIYQLRSLEDPLVVPDKEFCARTVGVGPGKFVLPARLWVHRTRAADGQVSNDSAQAIGTATGCVQLTNFAFPKGLAQNFALKLDLPSGTYEAVGQCTVISNDVPPRERPVVLAGCHLQVTSAPPDVVGGTATSSSVFNPFRLTGFNTGSYWTLHLYTNEVGPDDNSPHASHDFDLMPTE